MSEQIKWMNKSCLCHVGGSYYEGGKHKSCAVGIIVGASENNATWICWKVNKKKSRRLTSNFGALLHFSGNDADRTCLSRSVLLSQVQLHKQCCLRLFSPS